MTIKDVNLTLDIHKILEAHGVKIEEVSTFLYEIQQDQVILQELLKTYTQMQKERLTLPQIKTLLTYKTELEQKKITQDKLEILYDTSKQLGDFESIFESINTYGSLKSLTDSINQLKGEKSTLEHDEEILTEKINGLHDKKRKTETTLATYSMLQKEGFDKPVLDDLKKVSDKYGGVKNVLTAVNVYTQIEDLTQKISDLKQKKSNVESDLKKVDADHAHLKTLITMSETLLYTYKFSIPSIADILKIAEKYGEPLSVLKALGKYEDLQKIEGEITLLSTAKTKLHAKVDELTSKVQELRATINEIQTSLHPPLETLKNSIDDLPTKIGAAYQNSLDKIQEKALEAGKSLGVVEEKIQKTREIAVLIDLIERPAEAEIDDELLTNVSLGFVKGLQTYVEIHKARILESYNLLLLLKDLSKILVEQASRGKRQ